MSRASNLSDHEFTNFLVEDKPPRLGPAYCMAGRFTQPNVLPNGSLVLCCMDYGLDEIHGNLIEEKLDFILEKSLEDLARRIYYGEKNLCSKCEWLHPIN